MSQDLVRQTYSQRGHPGGATSLASADDLWMQQQALAVAGNNGGNEVQPLQVVHRSLRGRYKLAILLAVAGAAVGAAVGWTSHERLYRGSGQVRIQPDVTSARGDKENNISEYTRYMGSEASEMRSEEIALRAMSRPEWTDVVGKQPWDPAAFIASLRTQFINNAQHIQISFDHPDRRVAIAGVKATLAAYADFRADKQRNMFQFSAEYLEKQKKDIEAQIAADQNMIASIRRDNEKGNIEERGKAMAARLEQFRNLRADKLLLIEQMEAMKAKVGKPQIDLQSLAPREPVLARLLNNRDALAAELISLRSVHGDGSPRVQQKIAEINSLNTQIDTLAEAISRSAPSYGTIYPISPGVGGGQPIEVTDARIALEKDSLVPLNDSIANFEKDVAGFDAARFAIDDLNNSIKAKRDQLDGVNGINAMLERAIARSQTIGAQATILANPNAEVQQDKRKTMAAFGFVVGGGLPLMALVAFGLLDRKYRYSDEATASGGTRGVPLLGILPNLPDRLSDPSQASVAAHCVHQIRTMLQLNCLDDGPSVLAVTSATSGDGKTSLCLALGLSFSSAGSRTLLVDTDLIGAGLSARLGIREPVGISEAITARNPMDYVRETAGLSVLPVGAQGAQNASAFSPTAVRKLVAEIRKHFDIVLIDTGPVLGSIEATPVVAAADAVILTVARGQNRDLVEKAIEHLRKIGARIAGVVFNRANARDFERSISGISLRSVSRASASAANGHSANGKHQDKRLGPLVQSVRGGKDEN